VAAVTKVLAAINSSLAAKPVLGMACAVAPFFRATVEAVTVREDGAETATSEAEAANVPLRILEGDPEDEIFRAVDDDEAALLVIGAHSHAVGRHAGHLPFAVAARSDKPVIVVDPSCTPPERLHRVLVAVEGTSARAKPLRRAVQLAEASGLEVIVLHVDDESSLPSFTDQVQHETDAYVQQFFARFLPGLSTTRLELRIGPPADQILGTAEETGAELIAVGWPQAGGAHRGHVAREVLERTTLPVLLVATA
jgi:nucleotide-binding universal stress UspA family protein